MPRSTSLTDKQKNILQIISAAIKKDGMAPTLGELVKILTLSARTVVQHLEALEKKGFILRQKYQSRGIELVGNSTDSTLITLPVVSAAGCDNLSTLAGEVFDEYITVDKSFLKEKKPEQVVIVKAVGNSMVDAGIDDGDFVITELTKQVKNGDMVVAVIEGMATIKAIFYTANAILLKPLSPDKSYQPIIMKRDFTVVGKVLEIIKNRITNELTYEPV